MRLLLFWLLAFVPMFAAASAQPPASYYDRTGRADAVAGGVRMIDISTPSGNFRVWTRRVGNNPRLKVLLLHGGPAATHEYFEAFDSFFPGEGIEYYYYDQLGSAYSDQPSMTVCGRSTGLSTRSSRSEWRLASDPTISACSGKAGAASWRSNMRCATSATSNA
jgi:pimeloyl-ACP methyl ester carboxylesterase